MCKYMYMYLAPPDMCIWISGGSEKWFLEGRGMGASARLAPHLNSNTAMHG